LGTLGFLGGPERQETQTAGGLPKRASRNESWIWQFSKRWNIWLRDLHGRSEVAVAGLGLVHVWWLSRASGLPEPGSIGHA